MDRGEGFAPVRLSQPPLDSRSFDYALPAGSEVRVRAFAKGSAGQRVSVETPVRIEADIAYTMVAHIGPENPTNMCMGCGRPVSTPLEAAEPDGPRLWLYQTFNGISEPIIF